MTPSLYKSSFDTGYVQYVSNSFYPYLFPFCPSFSAEMSTCSAPITVIIHIFKHRLLGMCGIDFSICVASTSPYVWHRLLHVIIFLHSPDSVLCPALSGKLCFRAQIRRFQNIRPLHDDLAREDHCMGIVDLPLYTW